MSLLNTRCRGYELEPEKDARPGVPRRHLPILEESAAVDVQLRETQDSVLVACPYLDSGNRSERCKAGYYIKGGKSYELSVPCHVVANLNKKSQAQE